MRSADPKDYWARLLPEIDGQKYPILGGIDPYGNTLFNGLQMRRFLHEWTDVSAKARTPEGRDLVAKIDELARRCRDEVHLYIHGRLIAGRYSLI
jgi:hypothetical protein